MSITGRRTRSGGDRRRSASRSATSSPGCSARWRPGRAGRPGAGRGGAAAASGSTCRSSRSTLAAPRQPGPERVRRPAARRAGAATPTRTSSRTRRSRPPTARSPWRSGASASGRGSARPSALAGPGRPIRGSPRTATGWSTATSCGRSSPRGSRPGPPPTGWRPSTPPRSRRGRSTTSSAAFATPQAVARRRWRAEVEHPQLGRGRPGRRSRSQLSATPATIRTPPPTARRARGRDPRRAGLRP